MQGVLNRFKVDEGFGYGFFKVVGHKDVFVGVVNAKKCGLEQMIVGNPFEFDLETTKDGRLQATNIKVIDALTPPWVNPIKAWRRKSEIIHESWAEVVADVTPLRKVR